MKRRTFLKSFVAVASVSTCTACFGTFKATRWVYELNEDVSSNKFVRWLVFLALIVIPVYEVAGLVDIWILNSLEFWTGSSPSVENPSQERVVQLSPKETLWMRKDVERGLLHMRYDGPNRTVALTFEMGAETAQVVDGDAVLATVRNDASGGVEVLTGGLVVQHHDADAVRSLIRRFDDGGAAATVAWARAQTTGSGMT